jgi:GNAT superfamily N-acetyltransferase
MQRQQSLKQFIITNTLPRHGAGVNHVIRLAFNVPPGIPCEDCIGEAAIRQQVAVFPEGQFVALVTDEHGKERVVGTATTMRTDKPPHSRPWKQTIGSIGIANHAPDGDWLYGVEMAVHPSYRRRGIGTALYEARFELVRRLNLRGWYAGGMLMGYHQYEDEMSPLEYGQKVIRGELNDPTVTMQLNRGFEARAVIEHYIDEPDAGDAAILIVWLNPDYTPAHQQDNPQNDSTDYRNEVT